MEILIINSPIYEFTPFFLNKAPFWQDIPSPLNSIFHVSRNFLYRDLKCGMICLSHAAQLQVLMGVNADQHFINKATFHSSFPILVITKIFACIYKIEVLDIRFYQHHSVGGVGQKKINESLYEVGFSLGYLSIYLSIYLSVYLSIYLSICMRLVSHWVAPQPS